MGGNLKDLTVLDAFDSLFLNGKANQEAQFQQFASLEIHNCNLWHLGKELFTSKEAEEFFHTDKLLLLLKEHKEKKADNSRKIWTVLTFLIWYDRFFATCSK